MKYCFVIVLGMIAQTLSAFDNPFSYNGRINDCDVIKYNGEYYITGNWLGGDMYSSRNLADWGDRTHIFSPNNSWHIPRNSNPDMDIHGTHIAYDNGMFHLYAHLDTTATVSIVHAVSSNVTGPYTEPVDSPFDVATIDVKTFKDLDGSLHYYSTRFGGVSGNHNDHRSMSDYNTLTSGPKTLIWPIYDWELIDGTINEGSFVFRYRDKYFMLYNGNHTRAPEYAIGCVSADAPDGFSNATKYADPVIPVTDYTANGNTYQIRTIGQPWVVEGLNGFERWAGYFGIDTRESNLGRMQRIDRVHFFDKKLYIDGPTNRYMPGYHPGPAEPQLRSLFYLRNGAMPGEDWREVSPNNIAGEWQIKDLQALQSDQNAFSFNLVNRESAANYLFEANFKMPEPRDQEDKAGVVAYYKDSNNWMIIGVDRSQASNSDQWFCHMKTDTTDGVVKAGSFNGSFDYSVYHKIRVEKNGTVFKVLIDDVLPPGFSDIETDFNEPGIPGLYTDHAAAYFDGIIYTIGWDEFDSGIRGWGDGTAGIAKYGAWSVNTNGLYTTSNGGHVFKGNLMAEYEFSTQIYTYGSANGNMGAYPVVIDTSNYLKTYFDMANNQFVITGKKDGEDIAGQTYAVETGSNYNLRAVKLKDKVILFVDGKEVLTCDVSFGESQVGLFAENMNARFNGILVYQTSDGKPKRPWKNADVGSVGFEGSTVYSDGTFTVNGSGTDIWSYNDSFHYVYRDMLGDGEISARFVSNDDTNSWDKAAVMFRDGLADNAGMALLVVNGNGTMQFMTRSGPGAAAQVIDSTDVTSEHVWLKVRRIGDRYYSFFSYNGGEWTQLADSVPGFSSDYMKIGLAVSAHNNARLNGAVFDDIVVSGCAPGEIVSDINLDCVVDIEDLQLFAANWLSVMPESTANLNEDGSVNISDFATIADEWELQQ